MRFYKGVTYNFRSAVSPIGDYSYEILDVKSPNGKSGFVLFGYDREHEIGAASRYMIPITRHSLMTLYKTSLVLVQLKYPIKAVTFLTIGTGDQMMLTFLPELLHQILKIC